MIEWMEGNGSWAHDGSCVWTAAAAAVGGD